MEDADGNLVRPKKLYYCKHHSKIPLLKRQRQEMLDATPPQDTDLIDLKIQELELKVSKFVPTRELPAPHHLVANPPLSRGRRRRVEAIEVDSEAEEERVAKHEEMRKQVLADLELKRAIKAEKIKPDPDAAAAAGGTLAGSKRKQKSIIDADVVSDSDSDRGDDADIDSIQSGDSQPQPAKKPKRLHKLKTVELSNGSRDRAAIAAENHELEISTSSNEQIEIRRKMRSRLERILSEADLGTASRLSIDVEAKLFQACNEVTDAKYRERGIDICSNLKSNAELRRRLLDGDLSPKGLAHMTTAEMATSAQKKQRAEESKQATREVTAASHVHVVKGGRVVELDASTLRRIDSNGEGSSAAAAGGSPKTPKSKRPRSATPK